MPHQLGAAVGVLLLVALIGFWARQLTVCGRWGQRPHAQRLRALGGVSIFAGLAAAAVGVLADQRAVIVPTGFVLVAGITVVTVVELFGRRLDRRRTERIHRDLGLH